MQLSHLYSCKTPPPSVESITSRGIARGDLSVTQKLPSFFVSLAAYFRHVRGPGGGAVCSAHANDFYTSLCLRNDSALSLREPFVG